MKALFTLANIFLCCIAARSMVIVQKETEPFDDGDEVTHGESSLVTREINEEMQFHFADNPTDSMLEKRGCCKCGTHDCCGSMCLGRK